MRLLFCARSRHNHGKALWRLATLAVVLLGHGTPAPAQGTTPRGPTRHPVGVYVVDLYNLDIPGKSFTADLWLWSLSPRKDAQPVHTMEFVNANEVSGELGGTLKRGDVYWSFRKITGTFRHDWDVRNYPFDRHTLEIRIEDVNEDAKTFVYAPDLHNSATRRSLNLSGWRITGFHLSAGRTNYETNFGDPALPSGSGNAFSQLRASISIVRSDYADFLKLTIPVYLAFAVALISFLLYDELGAQIGLLAAVLFTVVVNMQYASAALGGQKGVTLMDKIHFVALGFVVLIVLIATFSEVVLEKGGEIEAVKRLNYTSLILVALLFVAVNAVLIVLAIWAG